MLHKISFTYIPSDTSCSKTRARGYYKLSTSFFPKFKFLDHALSRLLSALLGVHKFSLASQDTLPTDPPSSIVAGWINRLKISYEIEHCVPTNQTNPLIIVANHPMGCHEALGIINALQSKGHNVKFLINRAFAVPEHMKQISLPVDIENPKENLSLLRGALKWSKRGGTIVIFPAQDIANNYIFSKSGGENPWKRNVYKFLLLAKADVLPVYVDGKNSHLFDFITTFCKPVRPLFITREIFNKTGKTFRIIFGSPIPFEDIQNFQSDQQAMAWLREKTLNLKAKIK